MSVAIRHWKKEDLPSLVLHANNFNIAKFMNNGFPHPYTEEQGMKFINYTLSMNPISIFAIDKDGEAIGGIGLHPQQDIMCTNAELGYWLSEQYWGQGILPNVIPKILDFGFENLNLKRIYARPFGTNLASQKVLQKCGFTLEARFDKTILKNGEMLDELVYAIRQI
jgi:RimJ/RimL family protein N-acetyltransferase